MKSLFVLGMLLGLTGCASTGDVLALSSNKYQVYAAASPARGGSAGAQERATDAAISKCKEQNKEADILNVEKGWVFPAAGSATVTFQCK